MSNQSVEARPLVTVITSVFNNACEISDAVESVLCQKDVNVELIVVDGASTDGTLEILRGYGDRINILISEKDSGIYDALNKGVSLATGDYVGFLHSDDVFGDERALSRLFSSVSISEKVNWPAAVYGDLVYVQKDNVGNIFRYWKAGVFSRSKIFNGWMPPHPSLYVRRDIMLSNGGFDTNLRISADYKFILNLFMRPLFFLYVPGVVVRMRVGGASNRSFGAILRKMKEDYLALRAARINPVRAIFLKNISKIPQLFFRP